MSLALIGDIGGTNARFALWCDQQLEAIRVLATADHATPEAAVHAYLHGVGLPASALSKVCLACAGPVSGDEFRFSNNHWRFSRRAFSKIFGLDSLLLINDFVAMAWGVTRLQPDEQVQVCAGTSTPDLPRLVIGPGTGLGVAMLFPLGNGHWRAQPSEGGHASLPVGSHREAAIWACLHDRLGYVNAEAVLSGSGLLLLYQICCELDGHEPTLVTPDEVSSAALAGDQYAAVVLEQFCLWLGRIAGDKLLTTGARGGMYIAGGMVPHFVEFFLNSGFRRGLRDKGRMIHYFDDVPIWLVTAEHPGLLGAGIALQQSAD